MAAPQPAIILPREITHHSLTLSTKPGASIHYSFAHGTDHHHIIVFLNGLMSTKSTWLSVMGGIVRKRKVFPGFPSMLAYDRYGSGLSEDPDPQDQGRENGFGHDVADAVRDLHEIISQVASDHMAAVQSQFSLILVGNSIGCAIARLYAQTYPGVVEGLLLLDSIMANSDFDWWPNPDADGFDANQLPDDVTIDVLREQRAVYTAIFRPDVVNKEGLDRRNLAKLLPESDNPKLGGPHRGPLVTVVGHDPETFTRESLEKLGTPVSMTMKYLNPMWSTYNEGLTKITEKERSRGPLIAKGCGHFIQKDDPQYVVSELAHMLDNVIQTSSAYRNQYENWSTGAYGDL